MKKLSLLVAPLLLVGALTGCNKTDPLAGKIKIKFMHNIDKTVAESLTQWAKEFNESEELNPELKYYIDASQTSGDYDSLVTKTIDQLSTDSYCDILYAYPDSIQKLIRRKVVVDLNDYIYDEELGIKEEVLNDIMPGYWAEGQSYVDTGIWSMPFSKSSEVVFVNQRLVGLNLGSAYSNVGENGILTEDYLNNLTWTELFENLSPALESYNNTLASDKKLYTPDASGNSAIFAVDSDDNFFITLAQQYNIPYTEVTESNNKKEGRILFDNDQMAELLSRFNGYYKRGYLTTGKIYGGEKKAYTSELFLNGSCLFTLSSTAGAKNMVSKSIIAKAMQVPHAEDETLPNYNKIISQGPSIAILDHGDDVRTEGAWRFYKFFLEQKSAIWATGTTSGYLPILGETYESEDYEEISSTTGKTPGSVDYNLAITYQYSQKIQQKLFSSPVFNQSSAARTQAGSAMAQALLSGSGTKQAIRTILDTCAQVARKG